MGKDREDSEAGLHMIYLISIPIIAGFICLLIPRLKEVIAILASIVVFLLTGILFLNRPEKTAYFVIDNLSGFILLAIGLFGFLIVLYSLRFMAGKNRLREYYAYILWTIGSSCGAVLVNNLILLLIFWGFLGFTLYLLINIGGPSADYSAKKAFIIVGGSDALMILGIAIIWHLTGSLEIDKISIQLNSALPSIAYILLAIGAFAKAGAIPVHTWIPDSAEPAPLPVIAFLPGSVDKLLGIYLLARMSIDIFIVSPNSPMSILLLIIGAVTVVIAVIMALIQHNAKKLLSYHAVSQAGYMVLGIGTGIPVGIAGGLFHMLNNALYKYCLFLTAGNVEHKTGTTQLDKLGGLARSMPITFLSCLVAALSISGVPPFNGFTSKWMVYQGIIGLAKDGNNLWPIWLAAAMFGSALTLASFMKFIHAIFLGRGTWKDIKEVEWTMWLPTGILAGLCIIFGVFAHSIPIKFLIGPAVGNIQHTGIWAPGLATTLIILGIILGLVIYWLGNLKNIRMDTTPFYGGEVLPETARITGVDFYETIKNLSPLKKLYHMEDEKNFDIYEQGIKSSLRFTEFLRWIHNGVLPSYLAWCLLGMLLLFFLMR